MSRTCATCPYWHKLQLPPGAPTEAQEEFEKNPQGQCRVDAPRVVGIIPTPEEDSPIVRPQGAGPNGQPVMQMRMGVQAVVRFPLTTHDTWCGRHPNRTFAQQ